MKILRFIAALVLGLMAISMIAETIEIITVKAVSDKSFAWLTDPANSEEYFTYRNTGWILAFKMLYSFLAAFAGSYLALIVAGSYQKILINLLLAVQLISLLWAAFFSEELSSTGPLWMWLALLIVIPIGIYSAYFFKMRKRE